MYNDVLLFVQNLSEKICKYLNVPLPKVHILISHKKNFEGSMIPERQTAEMTIELYVPQNVSLKKHKNIITTIVIHEHCHYYDSVNMAATKRKKSMRDYMNSITKRRAIEQRTWQCTKKVAKELGLWTRAIFKEVKQCCFTSKVTF